MKNLLITFILILGIVFSSSAQERKPAMSKKSTEKSNLQTQGYIKNTPSNYSQDKALKKLNDEKKRVTNQIRP